MSRKYDEVLANVPAKIAELGGALESLVNNANVAQMLRNTDPFNRTQHRSEEETAHAVATRLIDRWRDTLKGQLVIQPVVCELAEARYGDVADVTILSDTDNKGPDIVINGAKTRTVFEIKSGPRAENSSSRKGRLHTIAELTKQAKLDGKELIAVLFNAFTNRVDPRGIIVTNKSGLAWAKYQLWEGPKAWDKLTGERNFYEERFLRVCRDSRPVSFGAFAMLKERIIDGLPA